MSTCRSGVVDTSIACRVSERSRTPKFGPGTTETSHHVATSVSSCEAVWIYDSPRSTNSSSTASSMRLSQTISSWIKQPASSARHAQKNLPDGGIQWLPSSRAEGG